MAEPSTLPDLVVVEGGREHRKAAAAWPAVPIVALDRSGWQQSLRSVIAPTHVVLVTDGMTRTGSIVAAVRALSGVEQIEWYALPRIVDSDSFEAVEQAASGLGLNPANASSAELGGERCAVIRLRRVPRRPELVVDSVAAVAQLTLAPLPPTGRRHLVLTIGECHRWFAGWARIVAVDTTSIAEAGAATEGADLLLVDESPDLEDASVLRRVEEARALGLPVVGVGEGGVAPSWAEHLAIAVGDVSASYEDTPRLPCVPPIDQKLVLGSSPPGNGRLLVAPTIHPGQRGWSQALSLMAELAATVPTDIALPSPVPTGVLRQLGDRARVVAAEDDPATWLDTARSYEALVEDPDLHPTALECARRIVGAAVAGVPIVVPREASQLRQQLGKRMTTVLDEQCALSADEAAARDRRTVRLQRAAVREHSHDARWRQIGELLGSTARPGPTVSIVVSTNRPTFLEHLAAQLNQQDYDWLDVVVALHGTDFATRTVGELADRLRAPHEILRVPESLRLGEVLNLATDAARGDIITKFDDDDWYGPEHVWDLAIAMQASGAHLTGKTAEFVYLGDLDITVRRFIDGRGEPSRMLAGGTLMITKSDLVAVGGWRKVARAVDQRLIDDVLSSGGRTFRTHGFGYVLNRHDTGHTWDAEADYFLRQSLEQHRGLRLDVADAAPPNGHARASEEGARWTSTESTASAR